METRQAIEDRKSHSDAVFDMKMIEDNVWSTSKDGTLLVWSPKKSHPLRKINLGSSFATTIVQVEDDQIWCGTIEGDIKIFDTKHYKCRKTLKSEAHTFAIGCMLKRGNRVWVGTSKDIVIWNYTVSSLNSHSLVPHPCGIHLNSFYLVSSHLISSIADAQTDENTDAPSRANQFALQRWSI
jgi:hypothetical protein